MVKALLLDYQLKKFNSSQMTKTLKKPRMFSKELKQKPRPQIENFASISFPKLQSFKVNILLGSGFVEYNWYFLI